MSIGTIYTGLAVGIIFCIAECILCRSGEAYFTHELAAGTPFTLDGARELMHLGILTAAISLGSVIAASVVYAIMQHYFTNIEPMKFGDFNMVGLGIALIIVSLLCRYGAEQLECKNDMD